MIIEHGSDLEQKFKDPTTILTKEQLVCLVSILISERDAWITNSKTLQKQVNEMEKVVDELEKEIEEQEKRHYL